MEHQQWAKSVSTMLEPEYDPERLKTDQHYRYSKIDELTAYIETIEPYSHRVEYFMNTTLALGFELRPLNMGSLSIDDYENKTGVRKWWGLSDQANDADKALSRKLWFEKARHTAYPSFGRWANETLEQRKARYFASSEGWELADYAREQLTIIEDAISQFQTEYTTFREKKGKLSDEPEQVQQQRLKAPALVRSELLGNPSINWLAFSKTYELQSFGILWDMVGFTLFVKKQISNPTRPNQIKQSEYDRLTLREKMLIHCYEEREVIKKGEPDYNDYISFATPSKRVAYPNESKSKAKSLIRSIENVLPFLSPKAAQQAENELVTIDAKIV